MRNTRFGTCRPIRSSPISMRPRSNCRRGRGREPISRRIAGRKTWGSICVRRSVRIGRAEASTSRWCTVRRHSVPGMEAAISVLPRAGVLGFKVMRSNSRFLAPAALIDRGLEAGVSICRVAQRVQRPLRLRPSMHPLRECRFAPSFPPPPPFLLATNPPATETTTPFFINPRDHKALPRL